MNAPHAGTSYETWVLTLRAWADDPQTSLDRLPVLTEESFSPDTFARLITHITATVDSAASRWANAVEGAFHHAKTPSALAVELVSLRPVLARRAQLAGHPALPGPVREALQSSLRREVQRLQDEIERSVQRDVSGARIDTALTDRMLQVVRDNSFTAVLDRAFTDDRGRLSVAPLPETDRQVPVVPRQFRPRRMINADLIGR